MTSIISLIETIYNIQLSCDYLKNQKLFLDFFLPFWNLYEILNNLQKKMTLIADVFPEIPAPKNMVR